MKERIGFITAVVSIIFLTAFSHPNGWTQDEMRQQAIQAEMQEKNEVLQVKHHVKNNNVYVECYIPDFHFIDRNKSATKNNEGYIHLYLNGQKVDDIYTAAFVVRGLPKGTHELKVILMKNENQSYNIQQTIEVNI
ncbi:hypothetical protein LC040_04705 [Bacillus tianshenii]|nr:hypothetical protein LC040_04705 [Bacillus tianshenii]